MSFNKKFFATGGIVASSAECTTDTADIFGGMRGGTNINVTFNVNTIDSRGFSDALQENRGTITGIINNALAEKGRSELV